MTPVQPGLLLEEGIPSEMAQLQECLATGDPFDQLGLSVHSVANTLLDFLAALAQPVIPYSFTRIVLEVANKPEQCKLVRLSCCKEIFKWPLRWPRVE